MERLLSVSELARELKVSEDTVRRWDKKQILQSTRDANGRRLFDLQAAKGVWQQAQGETHGQYKILSRDPSGLTAIDLFAGAGGTALGLENAGFRHLLLSEWDKYACATLRANRPEWPVSEGDVASVDFRPHINQVDLLEGGFPCQAFSYAGNKLGFEDTRGTLFFEFARAVSECMPKVAVGENVKGLLNHDGGRTLHTMISVLENIRDADGRSYKVDFRVLRAQYFDVPQKRERVVIVAIRDDVFRGNYFWPRENNYVVTLREAIGDLPHSPGAKYPSRKAEIMSQVPQGGYWRDLPEALQKEWMGASFHLSGGKTGMARRLAWDEPSLTLTCSPAQKQTERCHPEETRPLNVREYARIQTFPDHWEFAGSMAQQYKQIGNAVPVNLGFHIGSMVQDIIAHSLQG